MAKHIDGSTIDTARAGDNTVARDRGLLHHVEVVAAVLHKGVHLSKRIVVNQKINALARRQLALLVLRINSMLAATQPSRFSLSINGCLRLKEKKWCQDEEGRNSA